MISRINPTYEWDKYQVSTNYKSDSSSAYDCPQHNQQHHILIFTTDRSTVSGAFNWGLYQDEVAGACAFKQPHGIGQSFVNSQVYDGPHRVSKSCDNNSSTA